jgi:hypothetical protein
MKKQQRGSLKTFSLSQNYPNPFNPETVIRFALPEAGYVKGVVYDILGREVVTLLKGEMNSAGNHQVKFDADGVCLGGLCFQASSGTKLKQHQDDLHKVDGDSFNGIKYSINKTGNICSIGLFILLVLYSCVWTEVFRRY